MSSGNDKLPLPAYIRLYVNKNGTQFGYQVYSHPKYTNRKFVSRCLEDKEKLQQAIDYLAGKEVEYTTVYGPQQT